MHSPFSVRVCALGMQLLEGEHLAPSMRSNQEVAGMGPIA